MLPTGFRRVFRRINLQELYREVRCCIPCTSIFYDSSNIHLITIQEISFIKRNIYYCKVGSIYEHRCAARVINDPHTYVAISYFYVLFCSDVMISCNPFITLNYRWCCIPIYSECVIVANIYRFCPIVNKCLILINGKSDSCPLILRIRFYCEGITSTPIRPTRGYVKNITILRESFCDIPN